MVENELVFGECEDDRELIFPDDREKNLVSDEIEAFATGGPDEQKTIRLFKSDHTRFSINDGICFLTKIVGAYNNLNCGADITTDNRGNWELYVKSNGPDVKVAIRAMKF